MNAEYRIETVAGDDVGLARLATEATAEGFGFLDRLVDEWRSGINRFDGNGETLLGAIAVREVVGVCGLSCDPYVEAVGVGRLRDLFVAASHRRQGIGVALVRSLLTRASGRFRTVRLRTQGAEAEAFYRRIGFARVRDATATHMVKIKDLENLASRPLSKDR